MNLTTRKQTPELMDDPGLPPALHARALRGLQRINWISGTVDRLWGAMSSYADRDRGVRVLDVGCGGGDVLCGLALRASQAGIPFEGIGCDISGSACEHAERLTRRCLPGPSRARMRFLEIDCLRQELPDGFHVAYASLFLHHLDDADAVVLLGKLKAASRRGVLVDDLVRSGTGYALAWVGTRLLSRSRIVHVDGPLSVEAAFTISEVRQLAEAAEMHSPVVTSHWPCRFLLRWEHT